MKLFLLNILLAVLWMFLWGAVDLFTLLAGFALGYLLLGLYSRALQHEGYGTKGWQLLSFTLYFIRILVLANWTVAKVVIHPRFKRSPGIIRFPVAGMTDVQITTLASAITLTPGTLSIDVSEAKDYLYVHCMAGQDRDAVLADLGELRERLMKEVFE